MSTSLYDIRLGTQELNFEFAEIGWHLLRPLGMATGGSCSHPFAHAQFEVGDAMAFWARSHWFRQDGHRHLVPLA